MGLMQLQFRLKNVWPILLLYNQFDHSQSIKFSMFIAIQG